PAHGHHPARTTLPVHGLAQRGLFPAYHTRPEFQGNPGAAADHHAPGRPLPSAMPNALVLGAGMVGSVIAADLACDPAFRVTLTHIREANLAAARARAGDALKPVRADLSDAGAVTRLAREHDVVAGALSSRIGYGALRAVIEAGKSYCDISFMAEDFQ